MSSVGVDRLIAAVTFTLAVGCSDPLSVPKSPTNPGGTGTPIPPVAAAGVSPYGVLPGYGSPLGTLDKPPAVRILRGTEPIPGVTVRFVVTAGGGTIADTVVATDAAGIATCGRWTLGAAEGANTVVATTGISGAPPVTFRVVALRLVGVRYDLVRRDGSSLRAGDEGFLLLSNDSTFRLVWTWGAGSANPYVAINTGRYTRSGSLLGFADASGDQWADGDVTGDVVTFRYDDYLDSGFHYVIVEIYQRTP